MKEGNEIQIVCPNCGETSKLRLISTNRTIGTVLGGGIGFGLGLYGTKEAVDLGWKLGKSIGTCIPIAGSGLIGGILGGFTGLLTGAGIGSVAGEAVDRYIVCKYECMGCKNVFTSEKELENDYA
jgi:hypothetical protein